LVRGLHGSWIQEQAVATQTTSGIA
jgi:hypothetical protein